MYLVNVTKHPLYILLLLTRPDLSFDSPENIYTYNLNFKKNSNEVLKYHREKSKRQACDERIYDLMRNDI